MSILLFASIIIISWRNKTKDCSNWNPPPQILVRLCARTCLKNVVVRGLYWQEAHSGPRLSWAWYRFLQSTERIHYLISDTSHLTNILSFGIFETNLPIVPGRCWEPPVGDGPKWGQQSRKRTNSSYVVIVINQLFYYTLLLILIGGFQ